MRAPWMLLVLLWGCEVHTSGLGIGEDAGPVPPPEGDASTPESDAGSSMGEDAGAPPPVPDAGRPTVRARAHGTGDGSGYYTGLNLRLGPSTGHGIVAVIPEGCLVTLGEGTDDRWREVAFLDHSGWAHEAYLEIVPEGTEDPCDGYDFFLPWTAGESYHVLVGHESRRHAGTDAYAWDFALPAGTAVRASSSGFVRLARAGGGGDCDERWGEPTHVVIDRGDGLETLYAHLATLSVAEGDVVSRGDVLGTAGAPGTGCSPHLHFQVQQGPGGGGSADWWNQSVPARFHDDGVGFVPLEGDVPVSRNEPL